jgi:hypothetical protein
VTRHPTAEWLARQITEAFFWASAPIYLVRDNDRAHGHLFTSRLRAMGIGGHDPSQSSGPLSEKGRQLQQVLADEAARPQVVEIIRSLIDRIEVHPGKECGHCEVLIVGALAEIIAFAQQKTTAAFSGDGGTSLMVAGARFVQGRTSTELRKFV